MSQLLCPSTLFPEFETSLYAQTVVLVKGHKPIAKYTHDLKIKWFVVFAHNEQMQDSRGVSVEDWCAQWTTHHVVTAFKCVIHGPRGTPFQKYSRWKPKLLDTDGICAFTGRHLGPSPTLNAMETYHTEIWLVRNSHIMHLDKPEFLTTRLL